MKRRATVHKEYSQYRKCGKAACGTCRNGPGHGPYIYYYWMEGGHVRSSYGGRAVEYTLDPTKLKAERLSRGWTIAYVAQQIGGSQNSYVNWEQGRHLPSDYARRELCNLFGLSEEELGFKEERGIKMNDLTEEEKTVQDLAVEHMKEQGKDFRTTFMASHGFD